MKAKIYTTQELYNLSTAELEKVIKTQAERYNKQITRAKKAGLNLSTIGKNERGSLRVPTNLKNKYKNASDNEYRNALISQYEETSKRFGAGATKEGLKQNEENYKNMLANYLGFDRSLFGENQRFENIYNQYVSDLSEKSQRDIFENLLDLDKSVGAHTDKTWYSYATALVYDGKIKSMSRSDISGSDADYATLGMAEYLRRMTEYFESLANKK